MNRKLYIVAVLILAGVFGFSVLAGAQLFRPAAPAGLLSPIDLSNLAMTLGTPLVVGSGTTIADNATSTFSGPVRMTGSALTNGSTTYAVSGQLFTTIHKFTWDTATVSGLAGTSSTVKLATLPAKTIVRTAKIIITSPATGVSTSTVSLGRVGSTYSDYVATSTATAATSTVYGDATAELGSSLSTFLGDFPSVASSTDLYLRFDTYEQNLASTTASTGEIYLETQLLP